MTKLYGLVQAGGFCFELLGVTFGVRANRKAEIERIEARLPWGSRRCGVCSVERLYSFSFRSPNQEPGRRLFHLLYGDAEIVARTENETELFDAFESDIALSAAQSSPKMFVIHAGVVSWEGQGIVIPGPSMAGKTTLVREFVRRGSLYYSDEFAVLDGKGQAHPFPRALRIREGLGGKGENIPISMLQGKIGNSPVPIKLILLTKYEPLAQWRPRSVSVGRGALGLLGNAFGGRANPSRALSFVRAAVSGTTIMAGVRGEASDLVGKVLGDLGEGYVRRTRRAGRSS
jgi:hypothetical protein